MLLSRMSAFAALAAAAVSLVSVSAWAGSTGRCGGTGGNRTATLTCPKGEHVVGLTVRSGAFVDLITITCGRVHKNDKNVITTSIGNSKSGGPGGGISSGTAFCSNGKAAFRVGVKSGALLDRIEYLRCAARTQDSGGFDSGVETRSIIGTGSTPGGIPCTLECPRGEALYRLRIRYGAVVDSVTGDCRR